MTAIILYFILGAILGAMYGFIIAVSLTKVIKHHE